MVRSSFSMIPLLCMVTIVMINGASADDDDKSVCQWTSEDGSTIFDLSEGPAYFEGQDQYQMKYKVNLCGQIEKEGNCAEASVCSYYSDTAWNSYGSFKWSPAPSFASLNPSDAHAGVTLAFTNGKSYCNGHTESVFVRVACDANEDGNKFSSVSESMMEPCALTFDIKHKIGCGRPNTISFILVLVIFKTLALAIYLIAGSFYNKYRWGLDGMDALPNQELWRNIIEQMKTLPDIISTKIQAIRASKATGIDASIARAESSDGDYAGV